MATVPDIPEVVTFGEDASDALARVPDAIETVLAGYMQDRRDIPEPVGAISGEYCSPSLLAMMKLDLYTAMRRKGWRKADLARALAVNPRQIDRLFDLNHATPVDQLELAFFACGQRVEMRVMEVA
jgi:antitoxin HicB